MKRAVAVLLCAMLATGGITSCQSKKSETASSSSVKDTKETTENKTDKSDETKEDETSKAEVKESEQTEKENQDSESTEKTEEETKAEADSEDSEMQDDLTMEKLRENGGTVDYTSLDGIELEPGSHIAVVVKSTKNGFWTSIKSGMDAAVKDLNEKLGYKGDDKIKLSFEGPSDETDVDTQINIIDAVLGENPSVLCLSAIDMDSCQAQLEAAEENGIPVVVLDSGVKSGTVNATCVVDNYQAGAEAAVKLADAIGGSGKIAVMAHVESAQNCQERQQGFTDTIAEKYPDIEIVNISHQNEETSVSEMAESVLKLFPDVKGYFCTNENMAGAVLDAIDASGKEVAVVGFDAGKKQKDAIKSEKEVGVLVQNAYGMGYATVVAAARAALGMENDETINPGFEWIDSENISDERYANYLYD